MTTTTTPRSPSTLERLLRFFLENKLVVALLIIAIGVWGALVAPFDWHFQGLPRNPVPVDAMPDIGENQQIVSTQWLGRSPQDIEDQITYPLTVALLGIPGVETVRSHSLFGLSNIYIVFTEDTDFYWSRSRVLEKLNSLPADALPQEVQPILGPDATALGQIFWYTLEGRDQDGRPTGGWDLHELRSIQDWQVRYALMGAQGVSEVASVGGFVQEYQIDVDPDAMRAFGVSIEQVFEAVRRANSDVGARTIEINRVEYAIRGVGFIKGLEDIENAVVTARDNVPVYVKSVATVVRGPALRRGALDKGGAEAVGGVVVVRYGDNPLRVIQNVKDKIAEIAPGLPRKPLSDGRLSQVTVIPFYDRTGLIKETLGTLDKALEEEMLVTIIVILVMVAHFRSAVLISGLLPLAVLLCFIAMKLFGVDANIVALSGIAIAIGTMVDMGVVLTENILRHLENRKDGASTFATVLDAATQVGGAVLTAVATTVVGFLPIFTMEGAEGKLFKPLAYTKTFALIAAILLTLTVLPALAHVLFAGRIRRVWVQRVLYSGLILAGLWALFALSWWVGTLLIFLGIYQLAGPWLPALVRVWTPRLGIGLVALLVANLLASRWLPLGPAQSPGRNFLFVALLLGGLLGLFALLQRAYPAILHWCLEHKLLFLSLPLLVLLWGGSVWLGFNSLFGWLPASWTPVSYMTQHFPGLGKEFMPPLDEGSFLFMPTTMPHASIGEALDVLQKQDMAIAQLPEVETAVGKLGRAETPLDPAPISMFETIINYRSEYLLDQRGQAATFRFRADSTDWFRSLEGTPLAAPDGKPYLVRGHYPRDARGRLIPAAQGRPFRLWRPPLDPALNPGRPAWTGIGNPDDIWRAIVQAAEIPGTTSAPRLQPIAARLVMLQSGMRAPMGLKIKGPDLETIEQVGLQIEKLLQEVPMLEPATINADRMVGKPYLEIAIDRQAIARYGIMLQQVQQVIEVAIGGQRVTTTVEGRQRYPVRVRYPRELRDTMESLQRILVAAPDGVQIPLGQLAQTHYVRGPQVIKSEDTFLVGYVLFDKKPGHAEVDVVEACRDYLEAKLASGNLVLPNGVSYAFAGSYENQLRAQEKLRLVVPLALLVILLILYFQFKNAPTTLLVFSEVLVAWAGGFIMLWLYGQSWFLDFSLLGTSMRDLFQVQPINLSVAVWVGFLALFGIATDNGVIMATYLRQVFADRRPTNRASVRRAVMEAARRRIRPCLMTIATTILALLPVLTAQGRGADIMAPMAIPTFGGMVFAIITIFVVPVLYCAIEEWKLHWEKWLEQDGKTNRPATDLDLR
ncbi:MAG: MMPL family transporter [Candidatus Latescibacteria bacterium]|nr:MMPL family transporter [Candidatus Latescibacterota bacterium]